MPEIDALTLAREALTEPHVVDDPRIRVLANKVLDLHAELERQREFINSTVNQMLDMQAVVDVSVRIQEMDEVCLAHSGMDDDKGIEAESELMDLVEYRLKVIREYHRRQATAVIAPPSDVLTGEVYDAEFAGLGAMVRGATDRAHQHAAMEERGELIGLVTPVGGMVSDPDEMEMIRSMMAQNITICAHCFNTGRANDALAGPYCGCPSGVFLAKKLSR